jgi:hypothetical protein
MYGWYFLYGSDHRGQSDRFLGWFYTTKPGAEVVARRASGALPGFLEFSATSGTGWQKLQKMKSKKTGTYSSVLSKVFLDYYYPASSDVSSLIRKIMRGKDSGDWLGRIRVYTPSRAKIG